MAAIATEFPSKKYTRHACPPRPHRVGRDAQPILAPRAVPNQRSAVADRGQPSAGARAIRRRGRRIATWALRPRCKVPPVPRPAAAARFSDIAIGVSRAGPPPGPRHACPAHRCPRAARQGRCCRPACHAPLPPAP
jgi:hypothetical protein